jgi:hypothetical protein
MPVRRSPGDKNIAVGVANGLNGDNGVNAFPNVALTEVKFT